MNKLAICKDEKFRVCLNGNLTICNSQEKKRVVIASHPKDQHQPDVKKRDRRAIVNLPKDKKRPDVSGRLRRAILGPLENKNRKDVKERVSRGIVTPSKDKTRPDVNCKNCKVDVKMIVDEMTDKYPRVLIKVSKLDPSEKMDMEDDDFDKWYFSESRKKNTKINSFYWFISISEMGNNYLEPEKYICIYQ